jgi:hypothetical protein
MVKQPTTSGKKILTSSQVAHLGFHSVPSVPSVVCLSAIRIGQKKTPSTREVLGVGYWGWQLISCGFRGEALPPPG